MPFVEHLHLAEGCARYVQQLAEPSLLLDTDGIVLGCNEAWLELLRIEDPNRILGRPPGEHSPPLQPDGTPSREKIRRCLDDVLRDGATRTRWVALGAREEPIWLEVVASLMEMDGARFIHVAARDVSGQVELQEQLRTQSQFQQMVAEIAGRFNNARSSEVDEAIQYALARTGQFFDADRTWIFIYRDNYERFDQTHEWLAQGVDSVIERFQDLPASAFPCVFHAAMNGRVFHVPDVEELPSKATLEKEECRRTGIQSLLTVPLTTEGTVYGVYGLELVRGRRRWSDDEIGLLHVIAELIAASFVRWRTQQQLSELARTDGLTGIANRRHFDEMLVREHHRMARNRTRLSLMLFDIDSFKPYNDLYGHLAGDDCLRQIAEATRRIPCRPADLLCRYGGEEFACIMPETDIGGGRLLAERMRRTVEELAILHEEGRHGGVVTASFGVASMSCAPGTSLSALLRGTDAALYRAKNQGGNSVVSVDLDQRVTFPGRR